MEQDTEEAGPEYQEGSTAGAWPRSPKDLFSLIASDHSQDTQIIFIVDASLRGGEAPFTPVGEAIQKPAAGSRNDEGTGNDGSLRGEPPQSPGYFAAVDAQRPFFHGGHDDICYENVVGDHHRDGCGPGDGSAHASDVHRRALSMADLSPLQISLRAVRRLVRLRLRQGLHDRVALVALTEESPIATTPSGDARCTTKSGTSEPRPTGDTQRLLTLLKLGAVDMVRRKALDALAEMTNAEIRRALRYEGSFRDRHWNRCLDRFDDQDDDQTQQQEHRPKQEEDAQHPPPLDAAALPAATKGLLYALREVNAIFQRRDERRWRRWRRLGLVPAPPPQDGGISGETVSLAAATSPGPRPGPGPGSSSLLPDLSRSRRLTPPAPPVPSLAAPLIHFNQTRLVIILSDACTGLGEVSDPRVLDLLEATSSEMVTPDATTGPIMPPIDVNGLYSRYKALLRESWILGRIHGSTVRLFAPSSVMHPCHCAPFWLPVLTRAATGAAMCASAAVFAAATSASWLERQAAERNTQVTPTALVSPGSGDKEGGPRLKEDSTSALDPGSTGPSGSSPEPSESAWISKFASEAEVEVEEQLRELEVLHLLPPPGLPSRPTLNPSSSVHDEMILSLVIRRLVPPHVDLRSKIFITDKIQISIQGFVYVTDVLQGPMPRKILTAVEDPDSDPDLIRYAKRWRDGTNRAAGGNGHVAKDVEGGTAGSEGLTERGGSPRSRKSQFPKISAASNDLLDVPNTVAAEALARLWGETIGCSLSPPRRRKTSRRLPGETKRREDDGDGSPQAGRGRSKRDIGEDVDEGEEESSDPSVKVKSELKHAHGEPFVGRRGLGEGDSDDDDEGERSSITAAATRDNGSGMEDDATTSDDTSSEDDVEEENVSSSGQRLGDGRTQHDALCKVVKKLLLRRRRVAVLQQSSSSNVVSGGSNEEQEGLPTEAVPEEDEPSLPRDVRNNDAGKAGKAVAGVSFSHDKGHDQFFSFSRSLPMLDRMASHRALSDALGGQRVPFDGVEVSVRKEERERAMSMPFSEVAELKAPSTLPPGIQILGFKPLDLLRNHHQIGKPLFLRPTPGRPESATAFASLWQAMSDCRRFAVCRFVRRGAAPLMAALVAAEGRRTPEGVQWEPQGFFLVPLPYKEDIRHHEREGERAPAAVAAAAEAEAAAEARTPGRSRGGKKTFPPTNAYTPPSDQTVARAEAFVRALQLRPPEDREGCDGPEDPMNLIESNRRTRPSILLTGGVSDADSRKLSRDLELIGFFELSQFRLSDLARRRRQLLADFHTANRDDNTSETPPLSKCAASWASAVESRLIYESLRNAPYHLQLPYGARGGDRDWIDDVIKRTADRESGDLYDRGSQPLRDDLTLGEQQEALYALCDLSTSPQAAQDLLHCCGQTRHAVGEDDPPRPALVGPGAPLSHRCPGGGSRMDIDPAQQQQRQRRRPPRLAARQEQEDSGETAELTQSPEGHDGQHSRGGAKKRKRRDDGGPEEGPPMDPGPVQSHPLGDSTAPADHSAEEEGEESREGGRRVVGVGAAEGATGAARPHDDQDSEPSLHDTLYDMYDWDLLSYNPNGLEALKLDALRVYLFRHRLPVSGRKADVVRRVREHVMATRMREEMARQEFRG